MCKRKNLYILILLALPLLYLYGAPGNEAVLRQENRELRDKLLKQEAELKKLRLWMANAASTGAALDVSEREAHLLRMMNEMIARGKTLAMRADEVSTQMRRSLEKLPLDPAQRARMALRLDELDSAVRRYVSFVSGDGRKDEFRILSFDRNLGIAVISGGLEYGVFPGMVFRPAGRNSKLRLRVISVRPGVSAAELVDGLWADVAAGMKVTPFSDNVQSAR